MKIDQDDGSVGAMLRACRDRVEMPQLVAAERIKVQPCEISQMERNYAPATMQRLKGLARIYKLTPAETSKLLKRASEGSYSRISVQHLNPKNKLIVLKALYGVS